MAQSYAKNQPAGFENHIKRVAIVGAGGQVGQYIVQELLKTGKHEVTAISRTGSKSSLPKGVKVAPVDYNDEKTLVEALKGQQFLFISVSLAAPQDTQDKLIRAAAQAGVPWVMPNGYGTDLLNAKLAEDNKTGKSTWPGPKAVEAHGVSSWVIMVSGFWYEYSLSAADWAWGFDLNNKSVTFYDDGNTRISTSTWQQCGRAAAALASLKVLPEDENDKSVTLSHWRNKPLYVSSFLVSQREMLDSVQRATGTTDKDWTITHESSKDRYERGLKAMFSGDKNGYKIQLYARTHYPNGDGDFQDKTANKLLGLPVEDFDEATQRGVDLWKSGYNAFARPQ